MKLQVYENEKILNFGSMMVCITLFLCFALPAQSQLVKIPFLGLTCLFGFLVLIQTRCKVLVNKAWYWIIAYISYNLLWSLLGVVNNNPGVAGNIRLGVIWPCLFIFVISAISVSRLNWIRITLLTVLAVQTIAIVILIGYGLQIWPNFVGSIFNNTAVGIHWGYVHVVGHFIGGMAFTVPYAYCYFVCDCGASRLKQSGYAIFWGIVVLVTLATSRRIMLIVIIFCALAALSIPVISKTNRKQLFIHTIVGLVFTGICLVGSSFFIQKVSTTFLKSNHDDIILWIQSNEPNDVIKYTEGVVLDPTLPIEDLNTDPEASFDSEADYLTDKEQNDKLNIDAGFDNRVKDMVADLQGESVRARIMSSVFENWMQSPIFGVGLGADLPGFPSGTGIYEMEYIVRLYTTGILGIVILFVLMIYVGISLLRIVGKDNNKILKIMPIGLAYLGAAIATTSNPYIFSGFDYLLMLFLPVAFMNWGFRSNNDIASIE